VVIVAVLALVLGGGGKLPDVSGKKKSSSGGGGKALAKNVSTSASRGGSGFPNLGNVVVLGGGRTHTREVTREVVKEVEVPIAPRSINCPSCNRGYVPAEEKYICPSCGAPTPKELIDESQEPKVRGSDQ